MYVNNYFVTENHKISLTFIYVHVCQYLFCDRNSSLETSLMREELREMVDDMNEELLQEYDRYFI